MKIDKDALFPKKLTKHAKNAFSAFDIMPRIYFYYIPYWSAINR